MVPAFEANGHFANLGHAAFESGAILFGQPFFGHCASRHHGGC